VRIVFTGNVLARNPIEFQGKSDPIPVHRQASKGNHFYLAMINNSSPICGIQGRGGKGGEKALGELEETEEPERGEGDLPQTPPRPRIVIM